MLKLVYSKTTEVNLIIKNGVWLYQKQQKIWYFSINVIGRIFKWIRYATLMQFILPVHRKPQVFFNTNYLAFFLKNGKIFYIFNDQVPYTLILKFLFKIKKPSIFNKRGFTVLQRLYYKKKGKITSYITNK